VGLACRDRLTGAHVRPFDRAIEWAQMGTNAEETLVVPDFAPVEEVQETRE
jgi:hypothetical protein